jgi:hypothetical protein
MTAIVRIKNFPQTIRASRNVRQHEGGLAALRRALADFKIFVVRRRKPGRFEALNGTARWVFGFETEQKFFGDGASAFNFEKDALRRIVDPAREFKFGRQPIDKRAEADALHRATHGDLQSRRRRSIRKSFDAWFHELGKSLVPQSGSNDTSIAEGLAYFATPKARKV